MSRKRFEGARGIASGGLRGRLHKFVKGIAEGVVVVEREKMTVAISLSEARSGQG